MMAGEQHWTRCGLGLAGVGGADVVDGQSDEYPLLVDHGASVVVPVGVLAGDAAVVVDQPVHGLWQGHDLCGAVDLDPGAEEGVGEDAQGGGGVASEVADLVGGLPAADDDLALAVDADGDGGGLEAAGGSAGNQYRPVVVGHKLASLVWGHLASSSSPVPTALSLPQSARTGRFHTGTAQAAVSKKARAARNSRVSSLGRAVHTSASTACAREDITVAVTSSRRLLAVVCASFGCRITTGSSASDQAVVPD